MFRIKDMRKCFGKCMYKCELKEGISCVCNFMSWYVAEHMYDQFLYGSVYGCL